MFHYIVAGTCGMLFGLVGGCQLGIPLMVHGAERNDISVMWLGMILTRFGSVIGVAFAILYLWNSDRRR